MSEELDSSIEVLPASSLASTSHAPISAATPPPIISENGRIRRTGAQPLEDEILAEELISGAPSRNGGRLLTSDRDLWSHNAWDKVGWDDEQEAIAQAAVVRQMETAVPPELQQEFNADPASFWDNFYANVKDGFFNDRAWLRNEFHELEEAVKPDAGPKTIVEIGCGPGNTLFPLLAANENSQLSLHGYDFSEEAVQLVKANPAFDPKRCTAGVWDLASKSGLPQTLAPNSVDIAVMIFVFSALHPDEWTQAAKNAYNMLKPGGLLLFRDYGRHDMAQLRFKKNRFMQPGLYVRGDHTRVYFFERDELVKIFGAPRSTSTAEEKGAETASSGSLELIQLGIDRRLLLNRKKQLKMYRVWLQGRWRKPLNVES